MVQISRKFVCDRQIEALISPKSIRQVRDSEIFIPRDRTKVSSKVRMCVWLEVREEDCVVFMLKLISEV